MLHGLHEDKHAPEDQRHKADALELQNGIGGTGSSLGEVGQDQRQRGQSPQHGERGGRTLKLERLLEVLARPKDETESDNAIENDHHRRKHRSRATRSLPSAPASIIETMRPASITVTATARRIEPKGSPSLSASTSA